MVLDCDVWSLMRGIGNGVRRVCDEVPFHQDPVAVFLAPIDDCVALLRLYRKQRRLRGSADQLAAVDAGKVDPPKVPGRNKPVVPWRAHRRR